MNPTIIFDFDGTLALGDGPITAFARAVADKAGDAGFAPRALGAVAAFESGEAGYLDGYDAVTRTATAESIPREIISAAYDSSRALLGSDRALVVAPPGLAAFLGRVGTTARLALATNAPGDGVLGVLESWGIADAFDSLHFTVGKPDGLIPVLREALAQGPVLAIGDIAEFDLAPAWELGADTALVGSTAFRSDVLTTMRGTTLADLYDEITAWVESAVSPTSSPSDHPAPIERYN